MWQSTLMCPSGRETIDREESYYNAIYNTNPYNTKSPPRDYAEEDYRYLRINIESRLLGRGAFILAINRWRNAEVLFEGSREVIRV
mgnify:CR=1 FL=1